MKSALPYLSWAESQLRNVVAGKDGWLGASCPLHTDQKPSLRIDGHSGGYKCNSSHCPNPQGHCRGLARAAGLSEIGLPDRANSSKKKRQAEYTYKSAAGENVGLVRRYWDPATNSKTFSQLHWDRKTWVLGAGQLKWPLYGAEVLTSLPSGGQVLVVEGEKCVEACRSLGFVATTTAGGAQALRRLDLDSLTLLSGHHVVILPDNDEAGRKYANEFAALLTKSARPLSFVHVSLPGIGQKGDVADWVQLGGTRAALLELIEAAGRKWEELPVGTAPLLEDDDKESAYRDIWGEPIPLERAGKKPEFPIQSLPDSARANALAVAEAYQLPVSFAATCILAATSTATLKRFVLDSGSGDLTHLNTYFITTLESGSGKSSCLGQVNGPIYDFERQMIDRCSSGDGEPVELGLISSDPTCEALEKRLRANDGRYAVATAEAGELLAILTGRYSNGVSSFGIYLKGYSGEMHRPDRVLRGATYIRNPRLSLNLALQPGSFERFWNLPEFADRGFTARFLVDQPDSLLGYRKSEPAPVPRELKDDWRQTVCELLDVKSPKDESGEPEPLRISLAKDARARLLEFREQSELGLRPGGEWESCREFGARAAEHVSKLAGLLHCLTYPSRPHEVILGLVSLNAAINLFQYYAAFSKQLMPTASALAHAQLLEHILGRLKAKSDAWGDSFRVRDLLMLTKRRRGLKTISELRPLLVELEELGYLRESLPTKGKPAHRYLISPYVFHEKGPQVHTLEKTQ